MYIYDESFYDESNNRTKKAAEYILPLVLKKINPKSIVDFGCGEGVWLEVVKEINNEIEIMGLDGPYVREERLRISRQCFQTVNLEQKIKLDRKYDLAMSFEVAEHISEKNSDIFIESLTNAADRIVFSAAIPNQGGTNHINEQWQSYWIQKFSQKGYFVDVSLRNYLWNMEEIDFFRRQNILYFSKKRETLVSRNELFDVVHPGMLEYQTRWLEASIKSQKMLEQSLRDQMNCRETYERLDFCIAEMINSKKSNIVIYPFGNNGFLAKEILNYKYQIQEYAIVDNNLCRKQEHIISVAELQDKEEIYYVLYTCSNRNIYQECLQELEKYVRKDLIINVFEANA